MHLCAVCGFAIGLLITLPCLSLASVAESPLPQASEVKPASRESSVSRRRASVALSSSGPKQRRASAVLRPSAVTVATLGPLSFTASSATPVKPAPEVILHPHDTALQLCQRYPAPEPRFRMRHPFLPGSRDTPGNAVVMVWARTWRLVCPLQAVAAKVTLSRCTPRFVVTAGWSAALVPV